ncbi:MAG: CdaR family protein [Tissierellia bacterium]|nr:CdaR family protein [Tissierellia bacterium]
MTKSSTRQNKTFVKIFSLLLAILLWSFVMRSENPKITMEIRNIPIIMENMKSVEEKGLIILQPLEPKINVEVKGKRNILHRLDRNKIIASVDMSKIDEENEIAPIHVTLPKEVELAGLSSNEITFHIDHMEQKTIQLTIEKIGELPDKLLVVDNIQLSPNSITMKGPSSRLQRVDRARVLVDLSTVTENDIVNRSIELVDKDDEIVEGVDLSTSSTNVSIHLHHSKQVDVELITQGEVNNHFFLESLELIDKKVLITGPQNKISSIEKIETLPIKLDELDKSTTWEQALNLPDQIEITGEKDTVRVKAIVDNIQERKFEIPGNRIEVHDVREGTEYQLNMTGKIQVILKGSKKDLDNINTDKIQLSISLGNNLEGSYSLPIQVQVPEPLQLHSITPGQIKVEIHKALVEEENPSIDGDNSKDEPEE